CPDCTLVSGLQMLETHDRESLSAHELWSRDKYLYIISLDDMLKSSPICILSKASKTKSWLWHRQLSHLNFGTLNKLAKDGPARGIPRLKFQKDHLCSACALGKKKNPLINPKLKTLTKRNYIFFIWICVARCVWLVLTGKSYHQTLREWYENVGISHQTSVARTPQQNSVTERRNRTLVEAARTMLIFSKALLFLWAEAINTACYTQNRSLIRLRYNKRTRIILETIHVTFDELTAMASEQFSSGPGLHYMTPATSSTRLVPNPVSQQPCILPKIDDWDRLFQPMFDEYFNPPLIAVSSVQEAVAPRADVLAYSPVSTSIDQDALSTSILSSQE
ncbi:retrovirus-related pol polyprotein from transposon TNT 1-94, partial [Tanacetum coccineum]